MRSESDIRKRIKGLFFSYQETELIEEKCIERLESLGKNTDEPLYAYWKARFQKNHEYQSRLDSKLEGLRWVLNGE